MNSLNGISAGELPFDREASREYQMYRTYANQFGESAALRAATDTIVKLRRSLLKLSGEVLGGQLKKLLEGPNFFMRGEKHEENRNL